MKFVHIADLHIDSPFINLADKEGFGDLKRLEQRKVLRKITDYIKENNVEYFFISGDLYEHQYVKKSTIEYINNLFKEIPNTKIFISPGNHDPYLKNSYYNKFQWNNNVHIFNSRFEKIELPELDIYGYGFDDFYCTDCKIESLEIDNKDKLNILVIHSTIDGANIEEKQYNSISRKILEEKGFDYVATGHIHKRQIWENPYIVYPGSTVSLGFDELGEHGMIVGNIEEKDIQISFIPLAETEFIEKNIDVTDMLSKEELIEKINLLEIKENQFVKIILTGKRNFEINTYGLYKLINQDRVIKIKNKTKMKYDLNSMQNDITLKGLFAKEFLKKLNNENISEEEKEIIEKAVEIGLEALE